MRGFNTRAKVKAENIFFTHQTFIGPISHGT
jgi:hypothetical protein